MRDPVNGAASSRYATALLREFVALGVRDLVVAPGSRSQALALAAAALESRGAVRLHVRIDERSAAFLALGLSLETGVPTIIVTTSGTAAANLHPAMLEAHHSRVPLIAITADRPVELRGIRSNQTTIQPGIFGPAVGLSLDVPAPTGGDAETVEAAALAGRAFQASMEDPGPVHLNIAFREPLSSVLDDAEGVEGADVRSPASGTAGRGASPTTRPSPFPREILEAGPTAPLTIVVAGNAAGEIAESVARAGDWPLVAEVSSGARFGPQLVVASRDLLVDARFGGRVERVIVFGHPTLSREVPALLSREGVDVVVVAPHGDEFYDPARRARRVSAVEVVRQDGSPRAGREERAWAGSWVFTSRALLAERDPDVIEGVDEAADGRTMSTEDRRLFAKNSLAAARAPLSREVVVHAVWGVTWPHDRLVFGASRLIRVADGLVAGKKLRVLSNRGLAGIDGTVSTALGVAIASQSAAGGTVAGITRLVIGDLTLLHDAGGLLIGSGEHRPRLQIIVVNDGGGTIFDGLEVASSAPSDAFDRVQYTPQSVDIASLAGAYGWIHTVVANRGELDAALTGPGPVPSIVEIRLPR